MTCPTSTGSSACRTPRTGSTTTSTSGAPGCSRAFSLPPSRLPPAEIRWQAYVGSEPHHAISARLDHYCDEATFVDWEQASPDLPDWQTSWRHLTADGQAAELTHPAPSNQ